MSSDSSNSESSRSDGRRRSNSGDRHRNRRGGNRSGNRSSNRSGGRDGNRNSGPQPRRRIQPAPLTFWQKILKAIGLYDPNKPTKRTSPSRVPKPEGQNIRHASDRDDNRRERSPRSGTRNTRSEPKPVESTRLYLGNLSYDATEADIEELFKGAGTVDSVEIIYNRNTHRSKGYGFVEMGSIEEAKRAVETLHDQTFMDRQLIVSGAKSNGPADGDGDGDRGDRGDRGSRHPEPKSDILPPEEEEDEEDENSHLIN
jgi:hypothetical protein